jgi:hypothetical protein
MSAFGILSFLVGAVLGQRFRVMVLLPVTAMMGLVVIPSSVFVHLSFLEGLEGFVLCAAALQAGYLFGSAARLWLAGSRAARTLPRAAKAGH